MGGYRDPRNPRGLGVEHGRLHGVACLLYGLWFRVWGLGSRVLGLGFGVWGLGLKVGGLGFGV